METITHPRIKSMSPQFLVSDIERSIDFYLKALGFELDFRYEDFYAGVVKNGCSIHLKSGNPSQEERNNKRSSENLDLVFSVEGIEELFEELSHKPVQVVKALQQMPYGKEFYIADPDGYIFAFLASA